MAEHTSIYFRCFLVSAALTASVFGEVTAAAATQTGAPVPPAVPEPPPNADLPEVETIIPESELQSVPSLPPEQDQQLQTPSEEIEEFERRLSAPLDVEGVAPANDPELNQSLPPLEQFDARPVEFAEPAPDGDAAEIRYTTRVEGLEAVDLLAEPNLTAQFKELSALRESAGRAANEVMLRARLAEDAELLRTIMESQGWYSAKIDTQIVQPVSAGEPVVARLSVAPGERYRIGTINVTAGPAIPPGLVDDSFPIEVGEPIVAARIQAAEATLQVALPQNGYPFAIFGERDILLDPETNLGDYTLPLDLGPRARFKGLRQIGVLS